MCTSFNWKGGYYFCQVVELAAIWAGIFTTSWVDGKLEPSPLVHITVHMGLVQTCLGWRDLSVCAADGEVLREFATSRHSSLSFLQAHTFDIPLTFLYLAVALHFFTVFVLFSVHPLWLPRTINAAQLLLTCTALCWFGLSSFQKDVCKYIQSCAFGYSMYFVLASAVLCTVRLGFHFHKFRRDGEDLAEWVALPGTPPGGTLRGVWFRTRPATSSMWNPPKDQPHTNPHTIIKDKTIPNPHTNTIIKDNTIIKTTPPHSPLRHLHRLPRHASQRTPSSPGVSSRGVCPHSVVEMTDMKSMDP